MIDNAKNIATFENLMKLCKRDGIDELMKFIRSSDFYTAPASTQYHLNCEGGLLQHSLNVYRCFDLKRDKEPWAEIFKDIDYESVLIMSLLHDLCKTNYYKTEMRNQKVYSENGSRWERVPFYTVKDELPYGHGEKSVMMIEQFIKLKPYERMAIRWHMGFSEPKESWNTLSAAINAYPVVLALHQADMEASYLFEKQ